MVLKACLHEWLSGGVSPCQGEGRGFESRLVLSMIQKRDIRWMSLFCMFKPCRARTVRMSAFHSGRRRRTSPGRSATSRALNDTKKRHPMDVSFLYVQALPGSNGSNVCVPLRSSQANVPRTSCNVSLYCFLRKKA